MVTRSFGTVSKTVLALPKTAKAMKFLTGMESLEKTSTGWMGFIPELTCDGVI